MDRDGFDYEITVCDGGTAYLNRCDDLLGAVALAQMLHAGGYCTVLRDTRQDETVGAGEVAHPCMGGHSCMWMEPPNGATVAADDANRAWWQGVFDRLGA